MAQTNWKKKIFNYDITLRRNTLRCGAHILTRITQATALRADARVLYFPPALTLMMMQVPQGAHTLLQQGSRDRPGWGWEAARASWCPEGDHGGWRVVPAAAPPPKCKLGAGPSPGSRHGAELLLAGMHGGVGVGGVRHATLCVARERCVLQLNGHHETDVWEALGGRCPRGLFVGVGVAGRAVVLVSVGRTCSFE